MLNVYLSASYARRRELVDYAAQLCEDGHGLVSTWVALQFDAIDDGMVLSATHDEMVRIAIMDWENVRAADVLVAFSEGPGSPYGRGGRHVEFGIALSLGLRLIVVGPRENVFHHVPGVEQFDTWAEARAALRAVQP